MVKTVILRFRDLVTPPGGAIKEHRRLIQRTGEAWWGWWMRPNEEAPRALFKELADNIEIHKPFTAYLLDSGSLQLYSVHLDRIAAAPPGSTIATPDPEKSPDYYHKGRYPIWFLLRSLNEVYIEDLRLLFDSVPTNPDLQVGHLREAQISSLEQLRTLDVTLWVAQYEPNTGFSSS